METGDLIKFLNTSMMWQNAFADLLEGRTFMEVAKAHGVGMESLCQCFVAWSAHLVTPELLCELLQE